jgi:DnaJ family protein C protein 2
MSAAGFCIKKCTLLSDRFKVLKHHPDKRRAAGEEIREGDDYFTNITKAFEILGNPVKRRG